MVGSDFTEILCKICQFPSKKSELLSVTLVDEALSPIHVSPEEK